MSFRSALLAVLHSAFRRARFCTQGEHKRETIVEHIGHLQWRCLDCGRVVELGPVIVRGSNRKVRR